MLGEVAHVSIGRTPPRGKPQYWTTDLTLPFCTIADMTSKDIDPAREGVTPAAERDGKAKRVPAGALLMSFKLTIGKIGFASRDIFPNEAIAWLRVTDDRLDAHFLALVLEAQDLTVDSGRAVKGSTLNSKSLHNIPIRFPILGEQRRIVDLIGALDAQIEALEFEEQACTAMLATLRREYLEPLDGTVVLTSVMSKVMSGGTPSRKRPDFYGGDIPWLKSGEIASPQILCTEEKITDEALAGSSTWIAPAGAVVVAMYGATAAEVGFLGAPMATNQAVLAMVPNKDRCDGRFAYHWFCLHSPRLKAAASGAAQPNLSKAVILREMGYPALGRDEQSRIGQLLDAPLAMATFLRQEAEALRAARMAALGELLSGAVEIPESYDALLESV